MVKPAIAFIDSKAQPHAGPFYNKFCWEPVLPSGNIQIGSQKALPEMTVQGLLETITKEAGTSQDILIVCHGTTDGLSIPIHKKSEAKLQKNALEVLRDYESGKLKEEEVADRLYFSSKPDFLRFWDLIKDLRKLKLNRVELRSCLVGKSMKTLKMLKVFFGSSSCSAPTALDIFGTLNPTGRYGPAYNIELKKKFRDTKVTGIPPNRFALAVSICHQFSVAAESQKAIDNWVSTHLPGPSIQVRGQFPVHGVTPTFGKEKIIWAGEKAYRTFLAKV